ncbi:hypothetical protein CRG98_033155 [Punica granatum]|uniref:Retrotransposon gag domain-containing protein n=1 Tax=Punica granatum TaxID=22663 RepID=A0A2I0IR34_PUNGR|nr:hypothetical protein CRG98_033155 [Punica granatum]
MPTTNQSEVVIDEVRAKSKKQRESSRDPLSSLEGRMTKMEFVMEDVQGKIEDASKGIQELRSDLEELREGMHGTLNTAVDELTKQDETLEALLSARPDVHRPKEFKGTRVAKDVDNFIWSMETYFRETGVEDNAVRVGMVFMYLVDVALLWWRRRCDDQSGNTVNTWEEFKVEFRQQFYPEYAEDEARAKLRRLEHKGELWEYDLHKAMSMAESLVKFRSSNKSYSKEKGKPKGGGDKEKSHQSDGGKSAKPIFKDKDRGRLKMVNIEGVPTCGVAKNVDIRIGQWSEKETIEVIPLDDYDFVIGMNFLDKINALLVPFANCICVLDAKCQCMVLVKQSMGNGQKTLSAMHLKRGIQKGEVTYLAALKVDEDAGSGDDVPAKVA